MTGGVIVTSFIGGRLVTRTGRYKIFPVVGLAAATLAFLAVMWAAMTGAGVGVIEVALIVLGSGFGLVMPNLMVAIQNSVSLNELGTATAMSAFFRSLGGTFGVAMSGAIMTAQLQSLHAGTVVGGARALFEQGIQQIAQLPQAQRDVVIAHLPPRHQHDLSRRFRHHGHGLRARPVPPGTPAEISACG